jgi:prepilin-type N-terminal cleavage/methylation domain-containing protein
MMAVIMLCAQVSIMRSEKGFSLIEVIAALAILGIIGVGFLSSMATASKVTLQTDERQTKANLAETQMEYVKGQGYSTAYTPAPLTPEYIGYTVAINAAPLQDSNIQKITITVSRGNSSPITLEGYKTR